jgi:hypothetical protein
MAEIHIGSQLGIRWKQYFGLKGSEKALSAYEFTIISGDRFVGAYLEKREGSGKK